MTLRVTCLSDYQVFESDFYDGVMPVGFYEFIKDHINSNVSEFVKFHISVKRDIGFPLLEFT